MINLNQKQYLEPVCLFLDKNDLLNFEMCNKNCSKAAELAWESLCLQQPETSLEWSDCKNISNKYKWKYFIGLSNDHIIKMIQAKSATFFIDFKTRQPVATEIITRYRFLTDRFPNWGTIIKKILITCSLPSKAASMFFKTNYKDEYTGDAIANLMLKMFQDKIYTSIQNNTKISDFMSTIGLYTYANETRNTPSKELFNFSNLFNTSVNAIKVFNTGNVYASNLMVFSDNITSPEVEEIALKAASKGNFYLLEIFIKYVSDDKIIKLENAYRYPPLIAEKARLLFKRNSHQAELANSYFDTALHLYGHRAPLHVLEQAIKVKKHLLSKELNILDIDLLKQIDRLYDQARKTYEGISFRLLKKSIQVKGKIATSTSDNAQSIAILKEADALFMKYSHLFSDVDLEQIGDLKMSQAQVHEGYYEKMRFLREAEIFYNTAKDDSDIRIAQFLKEKENCFTPTKNYFDVRTSRLILDKIFKVREEIESVKINQAFNDEMSFDISDDEDLNTDESFNDEESSLSIDSSI